MRLITNPSSKHLEEVLFWLNNEESTFSRHTTKIRTDFVNRNLIVCEVDGQIIGYLSFNNSGSIVEFDLMEINPYFLRKGLGKAFFQLTKDYFANLGCKVIKLFCEPRHSEEFWKKMKFSKFPDATGLPELTYYLPLTDVIEEGHCEVDNKIELWSSFVSYSKNLPPYIFWDISINDRPLLLPDNNDFYIRLTIQGKDKKVDRMKYFFNRKKCIEIYPFIIIKDVIQSTQMGV